MSKGIRLDGFSLTARLDEPEDKDLKKRSRSNMRPRREPGQCSWTFAEVRDSLENLELESSGCPKNVNQELNDCKSPPDVGASSSARACSRLPGTSNSLPSTPPPKESGVLNTKSSAFRSQTLPPTTIASVAVSSRERSPLIVDGGHSSLASSCAGAATKCATGDGGISAEFVSVPHNHDQDAEEKLEANECKKLPTQITNNKPSRKVGCEREVTNPELVTSSGGQSKVLTPALSGGLRSELDREDQSAAATTTTTESGSPTQEDDASLPCEAFADLSITCEEPVKSDQLPTSSSAAASTPTTPAHKKVGNSLKDAPEATPSRRPCFAALCLGMAARASLESLTANLVHMYKPPAVAKSPTRSRLAKKTRQKWPTPSSDAIHDSPRGTPLRSRTRSKVAKTTRLGAAKTTRSEVAKATRSKAATTTSSSSKPPLGSTVIADIDYLLPMKMAKLKKEKAAKMEKTAMMERIAMMERMAKMEETAKMEMAAKMARTTEKCSVKNMSLSEDSPQLFSLKIRVDGARVPFTSMDVKKRTTLANIRKALEWRSFKHIDGKFKFAAHGRRVYDKAELDTRASDCGPELVLILFDRRLSPIRFPDVPEVHIFATLGRDPLLTVWSCLTIIEVARIERVCRTFKDITTHARDKRRQQYFFPPAGAQNNGA